MIRLVVIAGFAMIGWTAPAHSRDAEPKGRSEAGYSVAQALQQAGPTRTSGIEASVLGMVPLEEFFAALKNSHLRAREVVLLPGARIAVHTHDRRPAMVHVLEGELVEHRSDSAEPLIRRQGDTYFETFGVTHWVENVSPNRVRVLAVDIVTRDPE